MRPERWRQVKNLFAIVDEMPAGEREAYLDQTCADDPELRTQVKQLLEWRNAADSFLEQPAHDLLNKQAFDPLQPPGLPDQLTDLFWKEIYGTAPRNRAGRESSRQAVDVGKVLLHYQIVEKVGQGGMGVVYRADDLKLGRPVAVKILAPDTIEDPTAKLRLVREARAASALNHPNIVTVYAIEEVEGATFLVMEFIEGEPLSSVLIRGPLPFIRVVEIGQQIADAIGVAHAAGIVHRDIKPPNIILTPRGHPKVLDFGLAKKIRTLQTDLHTGIATLSATGVITGTVAYMSPEQTRGEPLDAGSDVFSMGVLLYEAATGQRPFRGASMLAIMHEIATVQPLPPSAINREIPREFDLILQRALAKDKEQRYRNGTELAEALATLGQVERVEPQAPLPESRSATGPVEPFVGREPEIQQLTVLLRQALDGAGKIVFLTGEPGIGKSTLAEEFIRRAARQYPSIMIARGRCVEHYGTGEAYLPFLDALSTVLEGPSRNRIIPVLRVQAPTWSLQLPALFGSPGIEDQLRRETIGASKERMLREFGEALAILASSAPIVLLLEDLHWADPSTIDLLRHLCPRLAGHRILLVGTFRPEDLQTVNVPLSKFKAEAQAHKLCDEIGLGALRLENIAGYLDGRFDPNGFPGDLPSLLLRKTEGNPLFVMSQIQFLEDCGDIVQVNSEWTLARPLSTMDLGIPESVRSLIRKQIETLGEEDRRVLQYASVCGDDFLSTVLAKLLEEGEMQVEERLARLAKSHRFIQVIGEEELPDETLATNYRFAHALYQNLLYDDLVSRRRILLHCQIGEQLVTHYGDQAPQIASQLAVHFERGREFVRAVQYRTLAGDHAMGAYAHGQAIEHYTHAMTIVNRIPAAERIEIEAGLYHKRGMAEFGSSLFEGAVEDLTRMLDRARLLGSAALECEALQALLLVLHYSHRAEEFNVRLVEAFAAQERTGSEPARLQMMFLLGMQHMTRGELNETRRIYDDVIPTAEAIGDRRSLTMMLAGRALVHFFDAEYATAANMAQRSLSYARELLDSSSLMLSYMVLALARGNQGRVSEALDVLNTVTEVGRRNGDTFWSARFPNCIGWLYRELQAFDQAHAYDQEGIQFARRARVLEAEANSLINAGLDTIEGARGNAAPILAEVETVFARDDFFRWRYNLRLQVSYCEQFLRSGDLTAARESADRLHDFASRSGARKYIALAHTLRGRIEMANFEYDRALADLSEAVDLLRVYPAPLQAWKTYAVLGRLHQRRDDRQGASRAFDAAAAIVNEIARNIDNTALRSTFLNSRAVQDVFAGAGNGGGEAP